MRALTPPPPRAQAASDVNSPISGTVVEVNEKLTDSPALINSSPFEDAWIMKVKASNPGACAPFQPGSFCRCSRM